MSSRKQQPFKVTLPFMRIVYRFLHDHALTMLDMKFYTQLDEKTIRSILAQMFRRKWVESRRSKIGGKEWKYYNLTRKGVQEAGTLLRDERSYMHGSRQAESTIEGLL